MATGASTPADARGRVQARRSYVLLMGPAVLFLGSALVIGGLFLPWYHADPRAHLRVGYPPNFQPFVPMHQFVEGDIVWFVLAVIPLIATLACLGVDATPLLRRQWLIIGAAICFGLLTLLAGAAGIFLLFLFPAIQILVPFLLDWGYFVSFAGFILLVPGAILLMIGQWYGRPMPRRSR